jgi:two-component system, chemotaxis family, chemotaxis protein CheY
VSDEVVEYVVVAEDSAPNRMILVHLLKKLQFGVIECMDGAQAWESLQKNKDKKIIAILSDIMMPNLDGLALLKKVRESQQYGPIPFVMVTAVSEKDQIAEAKNLKVDGYLLKPVTFDRVSKKLQELFPNKTFRKIAS